MRAFIMSVLNNADYDTERRDATTAIPVFGTNPDSAQQTISQGGRNIHICFQSAPQLSHQQSCLPRRLLH